MIATPRAGCTLAVNRDRRAISTKTPPVQVTEGVGKTWSTRPGSNRRPPRWQENPNPRNRQYLRSSDRHIAAQSGVSRHRIRQTAPPRHPVPATPPTPKNPPRWASLAPTHASFGLVGRLTHLCVLLRESPGIGHLPSLCSLHMALTPIPKPSQTLMLLAALPVLAWMGRRRGCFEKALASMRQSTLAPRRAEGSESGPHS